jgi:peroxiredoxin
MRTESDTLSAGDKAPAFTLPTQKGEARTLADLVAAGPVLLAFHRGTW